jgi:hypothetical protein
MEKPEAISDESAQKLKPEQARTRLENMGFTEDRWPKMKEEKLASHQVRALINIALGTEPKLLGTEYEKERVKDGLLADRLAGRKR